MVPVPQAAVAIPQEKLILLQSLPNEAEWARSALTTWLLKKETSKNV